MNFLIHTHSGLRWVVLILLLLAIFNAVGKMNSGSYIKKDKMINLFAMISLHVQLLLGLILYFMSTRVIFVEGWMKNPATRFFGMEHLVGMLIAIALITIGRKKAEKATLDNKKHKTIFIWYTIGLLLILASIPWPFRANLGITTWF